MMIEKQGSCMERELELLDSWPRHTWDPLCDVSDECPRWDTFGEGKWYFTMRRSELFKKINSLFKGEPNVGYLGGSVG